MTERSTHGPHRQPHPHPRHGRQVGHLVRLVRNRLGAHIVDAGAGHADGDRFLVSSERLLELVAFLQRDPDADLSLLVDICGVDRGPTETPGGGPTAAAGPGGAGAALPRFEVRYQLRSPRLGYRAHVVVLVAEDDPTVPSLTALYPGAEMLERELHEMLGIYPDGHPQLRSALLYPGFVGHPLRKDYRASKQQPLVAVLDADASGAGPVIIDPPAGETR